METLNDEQWRNKNSWWLLLTFIPFIDSFALLYIGDKVKRRTWKAYGITAIALWMIVGCFSERYTRNIYGLMIYLAVMILAVVLRSPYLKLLSYSQSVEPKPAAMAMSKKWRMKNSLWILWNIVPFAAAFFADLIDVVDVVDIDYRGLRALVGYLLEGRTRFVLQAVCTFGLIYIGHRARERKWTYYGCAIAVTEFGVGYIWGMMVEYPYYIIRQCYDILINQYYSFKYIFVVELFLVLFCVQLYIALMLRMPYLNAIAPREREEDLGHECLSSLRWRTVNSLWMLFCFIPYCAGASLIFAGAKVRKKKWVIGGAVMTAMIAGSAASGYIIQRSWGGYEIRENVGEIFAIFMVFIAVASFGMCTCIRREFLICRAEQLHGYSNEIDREIGEKIELRQHMEHAAEKSGAPSISQTLATDIAGAGSVDKAEFIDKVESGNRAGSAEKPELADKAESVNGDASDEVMIDINTCTKEELLSLPGISVPDAVKAVNYREDHEGFKSVDEFIDVLGVKPHFAVQIFQKTTAVQITKNSDEGRAVKRMIDI